MSYTASEKLFHCTKPSTVIIYTDIQLDCLLHTLTCRYPAGFVYIYSVLYYVTGYGENIALAQIVFAGLYLFNLALVMAVYSSVARVSGSRTIG